MRALPLLFVLLISCNPVTGCDKPGTDCCNNAAQCEAFYGSEFPFCGPAELCTECLIDAHCPAGQTCEPDTQVGALCL